MHWIFALVWNCNFAVGSSVGWVFKLRSLQERCGTIVSSPSWARQVPFFSLRILFMILCGFVLFGPVHITTNDNELWGDSVLHGFNLLMDYCHTSSEFIVQVNSKHGTLCLTWFITNKQTLEKVQKCSPLGIWHHKFESITHCQQ